MRSYDVAVASLAIRAPRKWTDNILSQHQVPGVISFRRGVARRINYPAVLLLAITRLLHTEFDLSVVAALRMAGNILAPDSQGTCESGPLRITLDRPTMEQELAQRLADALESAPRPRRGRPPRRPTT